MGVGELKGKNQKGAKMMEEEANAI